MSGRIVRLQDFDSGRTVEVEMPSIDTVTRTPGTLDLRARLLGVDRAETHEVEWPHGSRPVFRLVHCERESGYQGHDIPNAGMVFRKRVRGWSGLRAADFGEIWDHTKVGNLDKLPRELLEAGVAGEIPYSREAREDLAFIATDHFQRWLIHVCAHLPVPVAPNIVTADVLWPTKTMEPKQRFTLRALPEADREDSEWHGTPFEVLDRWVAGWSVRASWLYEHRIVKELPCKGSVFEYGRRELARLAEVATPRFVAWVEEEGIRLHRRLVLGLPDEPASAPVSDRGELPEAPEDDPVLAGDSEFGGYARLPRK